MIKRLLSLALVTGTAGCTINTEPVPFTVMDTGAVQVHSNKKLDAEAAAAFAEFTQDAEAFGAMYVARDGSALFWRTGSFSLADVELEARTTCAAMTDTACIRYATLVPAGPATDSALPARIAAEMTRAMRKTKTGDYVALAAMPSGAYGFGFNYETAAEAEARAMEECQLRVDSEQEEADINTLPALISAGVYECRIIQTYRR